MRKLDVIQVGEFPQDPAFIKGGVEASVYGLTRALRESGAVGTVRVFALPANKKTLRAARRVEGVDVQYFDAPHKFMSSSAVYAPQVMRGLGQAANPVLHVHGTGLFQALLCIAARGRKIPLVWTMHGITARETRTHFLNRKTPVTLLRHVFYRLLEALQMRVASNVIVDTAYVRDGVRNAARAHVIPQGIFTTELLACRSAERNKPVILSLGVMEPRKGHHLTLEAFAKVAQRIPEARLVIAGAETDPGYCAMLRQRAAEPDCAGRVDILVNLPRTRILELLREARIFALHSQEESQGIALCEAMVAGLPIVATRVGGIPFVVADGKTGFLVPYGDVEGFAAAMLRLLTNEQDYAAMAEAAAAAGERFDWESIAGRVVDLYRRAG